MSAWLNIVTAQKTDTLDPMAKTPWTGNGLMLWLRKKMKNIL